MSFEIGIPNVTFKMRVEIDEAPGFEWKEVPSMELFANKRVALFGLPGAFTPTCSSTHLPGYDAEYDKLLEAGFDEVYCISVNDSFTMNAWFKSVEVSNVKPIPDGSGDFTRALGMLVKKDNLGFGLRSWRYSAIVENGMVKQLFAEPGLCDNAETDPFTVSDVYTMLDFINKEETS
jgi:thioredoxin-dependent peroxiredoxin